MSLYIHVGCGSGCDLRVPVWRKYICQHGQTLWKPDYSDDARVVRTGIIWLVIGLLLGLMIGRAWAEEAEPDGRPYSVSVAWLDGGGTEIGVYAMLGAYLFAPRFVASEPSGIRDWRNLLTIEAGTNFTDLQSTDGLDVRPRAFAYGAAYALGPVKGYLGGITYTEEPIENGAPQRVDRRSWMAGVGVEVMTLARMIGGAW